MSTDIIQKYRRSMRNEITIEIKSMKVSLQRTKDSIEIFSRDETSLKVNQLHIASLKTKVQTYQDSIESAEIKLASIDVGDMDDTIRKEVEEAQMNSKAQRQHQKEVEKEKSEKRSRDKKRQKETADKWRTEKYHSKNIARDMAREERRYYYNLEKMPEYMLESLKKMPNNKGYVWNGIWCFGEKPVPKHDDPSVTYMQIYDREKKKTFIHESHPVGEHIWGQRNQWETKVYEKPKYEKRPPREYNYFDACKVLDIKPGSHTGIVKSVYREIKNPTDAHKKAYEFILENNKNRSRERSSRSVSQRTDKKENSKRESNRKPRQRDSDRSGKRVSNKSNDRNSEQESKESSRKNTNRNPKGNPKRENRGSVKDEKRTSDRKPKTESQRNTHSETTERKQEKPRTRKKTHNNNKPKN